MQTTAHGPSLLQLTRFPLLFPINSYLVREDDGLTLIDTGLAGSAKGILAAAGAAAAPIRRIVLTHAHADHAGSLDALRAALPAAEVLLTERQVRLLAGDRTLGPAEAQTPLRGDWLVATTRPDTILRPGDRVGSLEVVAAPGHTPDLIAFFDRRDGSLIAGDAFQTRGGLAVAGVMRPLFPFPALATWHAPTSLESAGRLRALSPRRLAVGHGRVLEEPAAALDAALAVAARRAGRGAVDVA